MQVLARHEDAVRNWEATAAEQQAAIASARAQLDADDRRLAALAEELAERDADTAAARDRLARDVASAVRKLAASRPVVYLA